MGAKDKTGPAAKRTRRQRTTLSWHKAPAETMRSFIGMFTDNGCAVLFGRTMDGGALMVQALCQDQRHKEYITSYADIIPVLQEVLEDGLDADAPDELVLPPDASE